MAKRPDTQINELKVELHYWQAQASLELRWYFLSADSAVSSPPYAEITIGEFKASVENVRRIARLMRRLQITLDKIKAEEK